MRLLQLLSLSKHDVWREMKVFSKSSYDKKFYSLTSTSWKDYFEVIKPYTLKYIDELMSELQFLDIYFANNDKLHAKGWGNRVSYAWKQWTNLRAKWDNGTPKTIWERVWKRLEAYTSRPSGRKDDKA